MNIYESIGQVMKDCGFVAKDSKNAQQGYKFRGIDAVMNALNPALIKNKVFVVPEVIDQTREERTTSKGGLLIYSIVTVRYKFYAEDGSYVEACVIGEGMDSGDKATNKAMSAAFKYACFQTFCIPTEEMKDSEDDSPEPTPKPKQEVKRKPVPPKMPDPPQENPISDEKIDKIKIMSLMSRAKADGVPEEVIFELCHVNSWQDITEEYHSKLNNTWDKVVAYGNKRKAG